MRRILRKLMEEEVIRYIFFGGLTTGVNLSVFLFLRYTGNVPADAANLSSITAAVIFAFFVNRLFVFHITNRNRREMLSEFVNFAGMRAGTLLLELFGVPFLIRYTGIPDFICKCLMQAVIIILNYIISKFVIFKESHIGGAANE